jgi:hypothetical protein
MKCPLPDGTTVVLGSTDCWNEPVRRAIAAEPPGSRSMTLSLCVADPTTGTPCGAHVPTASSGTNTDPRAPADYNGAIMTWVEHRLADP